MTTLLKQFIKKKILGKQKKIQIDPFRNTIDNITDLKTPFIASSFHSSDKIFGVKASPILKKKSVFFEEKDKKIERLESEILNIKKKMIDFYFGLKNSIILDQVFSFFVFLPTIFTGG